MIPLKDDAPRVGTPYVNYTLLVLNTLVFLLQYWVGKQSPPAAAAIVSQLGVVPARLSVVLFNHGYVPWDLVSQLSTRYVPPMAAILPLFTSMFLHGSWLHVIGNMWGLWIFGDNVEDSVGHAVYLVFYLTCGVAAALFHTLLNASSTIPTVGASGAIAGVMGAYLLLFPRARVLTLILFCLVFYKWLPDWAVFACMVIGIAMCIYYLLKPHAGIFTLARFLLFFFVWLPAWIVLGYWFVWQLLSGAATSITAQAGNAAGIAFWAHVGGFLAGMLLIKLFPARTPRYRHGW